TANSSAIIASTPSGSTATSRPRLKPSIRNKPSAWWITADPNLEALAIEKAIETGDTDGKFLSNYSLYSQRLNRDFQSTLKTLHQEQAKRLVDHGRDFRI